MKRGRIGGEIQKLFKARLNSKRGPFSLAGGVQVHLWDEWMVVVPTQHVFADTASSAIEPRLFTRREFQKYLLDRLNSPRALELAPFWVSFSPEQKHRNTLVPAGLDQSWPQTTSQADVPVISAFKLLKRWRDADLHLQLSPHF